MKPIELFNMKPKSISNDVNDITDYLDLGLDYYIDDTLWEKINVEVRTMEYINYDGYRYWSLYCVLFNKIPTMIIQKAGRGGKDHNECFIVNYENYNNLRIHIMSIIDVDVNYEIIDINTEYDFLDSFYNHKLK